MVGVLMTQRSYSYSQIQAAYKCLRYFKLLYVDRLKAPVAHKADLSFGTAIHAGVQAYLEGENGVDVFTAYWDSEKDKGLAYGRQDHASLRENGIVLLSRFERLHLKHFKPYKLEERIYVTEAGVALEGTPDFIGWYKDVPVIVDWKTAGYRYMPEKLTCNEQMPLYDFMAEKAYGWKAEAHLYGVFIKGREPSIQMLQQKSDAAARAATLENVLAVCRELDSRSHWHQNRGGCLMGQYKCDMFGVCFPDKGSGE
jgi:hypothetical protein